MSNDIDYVKSDVHCLSASNALCSEHSLSSANHTHTPISESENQSFSSFGVQVMTVVTTFDENNMRISIKLFTIWSQGDVVASRPNRNRTANT